MTRSNLSIFSTTAVLTVTVLLALSAGAAEARSLLFRVAPGQEVTRNDVGFGVIPTDYALSGTLVVEVDGRWARLVPGGLTISRDGQTHPWMESVGDDLFGEIGFAGKITLTGQTGSGEGEVSLTPVSEGSSSYRFAGGLFGYPNLGGDHWIWDGVAVERVAEADGLFLQEGRFRVEAAWRDSQGGAGVAAGRRETDAGGLLWFFRAENPELAVKVLDACGPFGRFWVFASGLTDVEVELTVTDRASGAERTYANPLGRPFEPIQDTLTFPCD